MKKIAFVIGGSSGIGESIIKILLENDYYVYNGSRRDCEINGVSNIFVDASDMSTIDDAVDSIKKQHKNLDLFIYCAGYSMGSTIEDTDPKDIQYLYNVNLFGFIHASKNIIKIMKNQGYGRIIAIGSIAGKVPVPYDSFYTSSKSALEMFCMQMQIELEKFNINVTCVVPGGVRTNFSFKRKILLPNNESEYPDFRSSISKLKKIEQHGMYKEDIARSIYRIIKKDKRNLIYVPGVKNKLYYLSSKIIPSYSLINIVDKRYKAK